MADEFNKIMADLTQQLEKRASKVEKTPLKKQALAADDAEYTKGAIGYNGKAPAVVAEHKLDEASNDATRMENKDKSVKYPSPERPGQKKGANVKTQAENVADAKVLTQADNLLSKISQLLETAEAQEKQAAAASPMKAQGKVKAASYLDALLKKAEDVIQKAKPALDACVREGECSAESRDEIINKLSTATDVTPENLGSVTGATGEALEKLKEALFPHLASDNKSPEVKPMQPEYDAAEKAEPKKDDLAEAAVEKKASEAADLIIIKAAAVLDYENAVASKNQDAIASAQANLITLFNTLS